MIRAAILYIAAILLGPLVGSAVAEYPQIRLNTDTTGELQNEQSLAINPLDTNNIVACWRDFRLGFRQVGVAYTFDGGSSWTDFLIGGELPWDSDPSITVDDDGTFYLSILNFEDNAENQVSVHRSTSGGASWEGPWTATYSKSFDVVEDKPWIAVDRSGGPFDGSVYVAWSRFWDRDVYLVRSDDRGETWTAPQRVSEEEGDGNMAFPLVLGNGNLLVAWGRFTDGWVAYDVSSDGGATWGLDQGIAPTSMLPGLVLNGGIASLAYPTMVVDESAGPRSGWVYCVYADYDEPNGVDVFCHRSTDHGATWSDRVRVNDDALGLDRDQFHPWLTVDESGTLFSSWYDRRHDPDNFDWHVFMSWSEDGGTTWAPNFQITDVSSSPVFLARAAEAERSVEGHGDAEERARRAGSLGEYSGIAASLGVAYPVWTDTRNGHQDTYVSRIDVVTGIGDVAEPWGGSRRTGARAFPNPTASGVTIELHAVGATGVVGIEIVGADGRTVRELELDGLAPGRTLISWDGQDRSGQDVASGVYHVRATGLGTPRPISTKLVLVR